MQRERRKSQVLRDLIDEFLRTGAAVGSKALAARSGVGASSSTIRSVMSELTREGLLEQPHTSAGRIPTEHALRLYIRELLELETLSDHERGRIARTLDEVLAERDEPLLGAARLLSSLSDQAGVLLTQGIEQVCLKRIELVRVGAHRVLVILISVHETIYERLLHVKEDISSDELQRYTNFLNRFTDGSPLGELRARLENERVRMGRVAGLLVERAVQLATRAMEGLPVAGELHVEGQARIVEHEDLLGNARMLRDLLEILDDGRTISDLLARVARGEGVQVLLGSDAGLESVPLSLVAAPCRALDQQLVGTLGVLGPTRMNYSRVIPLVSCLAALAGQRFAPASSNFATNQEEN